MPKLAEYMNTNFTLRKWSPHRVTEVWKNALSIADNQVNVIRTHASQGGTPGAKITASRSGGVSPDKAPINMKAAKRAKRAQNEALALHDTTNWQEDLAKEQIAASAASSDRLNGIIAGAVRGRTQMDALQALMGSEHADIRKRAETKMLEFAFA
ncbi:hypothetical protein JCM11641_003502 [Rhodosporidiobolus odoratus]